MATFTCPDCGAVVTMGRDVPDGSRCAKCTWTSWRNTADPSKPYKLSENDRDFLRTNRIIPEV